MLFASASFLLVELEMKIAQFHVLHINFVFRHLILLFWKGNQHKRYNLFFFHGAFLYYMLDFYNFHHRSVFTQTEISVRSCCFVISDRNNQQYRKYPACLRHSVLRYLLN